VARGVLGKFWASDDFQEIHTKENIAPFLNSTVFWLMQNLSGRTSFGGGLLKVQTYEFELLHVLDTSELSAEALKAFQPLCGRPVESLFSELGASSPGEVSLERVKSDRRELDRIIMGEILGLTDDEQLEVYRGVIDLVKSRLEKAKSFGKRKKNKEGIDVDLLVKTVMEKVGDETLGKFYEERVLSQKPLYTKTLPKPTDEIEIRQSLLGWRLYSGRNDIDCASELEARYLKVWLEAGMEEVKVPKDEAYLKTIIPELESLEAKIDDAIEAHLSFIANVKTRDRILRQLWLQMTKGLVSE
jgi:hypothetical protein